MRGKLPRIQSSQSRSLLDDRIDRTRLQCPLRNVQFRQTEPALNVPHLGVRLQVRVDLLGIPEQVSMNDFANHEATGHGLPIFDLSAVAHNRGPVHEPESPKDPASFSERDYRRRRRRPNRARRSDLRGLAG